MMTEYSMLDAKLTEKAKGLELAEEQLFRLFAKWQGVEFDGEIEYPMAFHIRDRNLDMDVLEKAARTTRDIANASPDIKSVIDNKIKEILAKDPFELEQMNQNKAKMTHPVTTEITRTKHIQEMIMQGYTDQQMLDLHPEITQADITAAKQELLNLGNNDAGQES
jgi:hypothetical protein